MNLIDFRAALLVNDELSIAENMILTKTPKHVSADQISEVQNRLSTTFGCSTDNVQILITGSANLGFSLVEKTIEGKILPRYREYSFESDVDISVIAPDIFEVIWEEVAQHACGRAFFPPRFNKFGDYLAAGWIRPDHFPRGSRLIHTRAWWNAFDKIRSDRVFGDRKVSGGLFFGLEYLKHYTARAVRDCIAEEVSL